MNNNKLNVGNKIKFETIHEGVKRTYFGFILWFNSDDTIQVSENKTIETMGLAQNWVIKPEDVIEVIR